MLRGSFHWNELGSSEKAGLMFKLFNLSSIKSWDMVNTQGLAHEYAIQTFCLWVNDMMFNVFLIQLFYDKHVFNFKIIIDIYWVIQIF